MPLTMSLCQMQNHELSVNPLVLAPTRASTYSSVMAAVTKMTQDWDQERASKLAMEAIDLADAGQLEVCV